MHTIYHGASLLFSFSFSLPSVFVLLLLVAKIKCENVIPSRPPPKKGRREDVDAAIGKERIAENCKSYNSFRGKMVGKNYTDIRKRKKNYTRVTSRYLILIASPIAKYCCTHRKY